MKNAFQKWVISWFVLLASVSIALALGWYSSLRRATSDVSWVAHTHDVLDELHSLSAQIDEAVIGVQGYGLTGDERFLEPYRRALPSINNEVGVIRKMTSDNPSQQQRILGLDDLVAQQLNAIKVSLEELRHPANDVALPRHVGASAVNLRQRLREASAEMEAEERRLLDIRTRTAATSAQWSSASFFIGTALNLAIMVLSLRSIRREIGARGKTEQRLRQSQDRFQGIFDATTFGMALIDTNGKWLEVNPALCEIFGYSKDALLATETQRLIRPDGLGDDRAETGRLVVGDVAICQQEMRYVHRLGHELWIARSISLVRDEAGRPLNFVSMMEDITPRKQAAEALSERTRQLADANIELRAGLEAREQAARVLTDRTQELANANTELRAGLTAREQAAHVLTDRTQELADANTELRAGLEAREHAARVLTDRTQELANANTELRAGLAAREQAAQVLTDRTQELADANTKLRAGLEAREQAARVLTDRTQELANANTELRAGLAAREQAAQVLTDRTQELADANTELRAGLEAREQAARVLTDRTQELADANTELRAGLAAREQAAQVLTDRTQELADANTELRAGLDARERAAQILTERTKKLEAAQAKLSVTAEFVSTLNQDGMLDAYRGALGCLARATEVPLAVIYDACGDAGPIVQCAVGPDHRPLNAAQFGGDGLPAMVVRTSEVQTLFGPFEAADLRIHFGLGEVGLHSVLGWPIVYLGRCLGALVTAHTAPLTEERRAFLTASIAQLAIRMNGFQVEQQRLQLVGDLQARSDDLQAKSVALEDARREAERASRAKSEFLANMSHELRTPMNSIMGFTQRLITKLGDTLHERELKALLTVDRNAKHLLVLINDILDLAKIEAGKMDLNRSRVNLVAVISEAVEQAGPLTDNKPVEVHLEMPEGPLMFDGDRLRLKQVVLNLLSNAIRYTNAGTVTIIAGLGNDESLGRVVKIAVRDTGVGIRSEDLSRLFQQFTQLDGSSSRKIGGTGLGLAISAHYVRMHAGRIDVASKFGEGTVFTVVLPLCVTGPHDVPNGIDDAVPQPKGASTQPPNARPDRSVKEPLDLERQSNGVSILCIDDEPDVLSFLQLTFEDAGYNVLMAKNHDFGIDEAKRCKPDLICLDLNMPERDGFEVLKSLRSDPTLRHIPVVVVSVSSEESECLANGALRYLAKPVLATDLIATVREILAGSAGSVLIVEDNPDTVSLYADLLAEDGLEVRTASNGREGLDCLANAVPSVIVLDLMMPIMDGFTFLERVQRDPIWSQIPVIILTAMILSSEEVARLEGSSVAILIKGRDATEQVIESILRMARPRRLALEAVRA